LATRTPHSKVFFSLERPSLIKTIVTEARQLSDTGQGQNNGLIIVKKLQLKPINQSLQK
jgi:hypothetical protein